MHHPHYDHITTQHAGSDSWKPQIITLKTQAIYRIDYTNGNVS
jgi:hypothetical protein